jgi:hypothetical protein
LYRLVQSKANENELLQKDSQSPRNFGRTDWNNTSKMFKESIFISNK